MRHAFEAPRALVPGARIAIVAPSSPFDQSSFHRGVKRLGSRYEVVFDPAIMARTGYLAGNDHKRAEELLTALRDPSLGAIVAARGGYGATRLLDRLSVEELRACSKLLIGFSDVTALHAAWARAGLRSIHGSMVGTLGALCEARWKRWVRIVEGGIPDMLEDLEPLVGGQARGPLVGGNLAVLAAIAGTPFQPPLDNAVLFLEDIGERPYRVDRMLTTLEHAGWFQRISGIALGAFTECHAGPEGVTIESVLAERLCRLAIPLVRRVPAGHVDDNLELPLGGLVHLNASRGALEFLEPAGVAP